MSPFRHLIPGLLVGLTLLSVPSAAIAQQPQPTIEEKRAAQTLADKGLELFEAGRYAEALTAFRAAEARVHAPPFLVMAARSCERLGHLLAARSFYQRVLDEPLAADAPRAFQQAQADAKVELAALAPRIPTLEIAVTGTDQSEVQLTVDGERISPATLVELDPGEHTLVGVAPGRPPVTRSIRLDERSKGYVVLDLAPPPPEAPPMRHAPDASSDGVQKALFIGGGAAAGVGVIAGTVFTILYYGKGGDADDLRYEIDTSNELRGHCPKSNKPPLCADLSDTVDLQYAFGNMAIGSFILGAAGVATLTYTLVNGHSAPDRRMQVAPLVGSNTAGLSLSGRF